MKKERISSSQPTTKISYDSIAKAIYIKLSRNKVYTTKEISSNFLVDIDRKGAVVGVEILNTTQKMTPQAIKSWMLFDKADLLAL